MASKYYTQSVELLGTVGLSEVESAHVARLASGEATKLGVGDVGLADMSAKASTTSFAVSVKQTERVKIPKGTMLTAGQAAMLFVTACRDFSKRWPGAKMRVSCPFEVPATK